MINFPLRRRNVLRHKIAQQAKASDVLSCSKTSLVWNKVGRSYNIRVPHSSVDHHLVPKSSSDVQLLNTHKQIDITIYIDQINNQL